MALREKELTVFYIARETDPPDMEILSHKARADRRRSAMMDVVWELSLTVLAHPIPGFRYTVAVQALDRETLYEFESFIVLFMFGRLWHVWKCLRVRLFDSILLRYAGV